MTDREAHEQIEFEWKAKAAEAAEALRLKLGFRQKLQFATKLGTTSDVYIRLSTAKSVIPTELYAKLFLLSEEKAADLDPRRVPPRFYTIPKGGGMYDERRWTDEEWEAWKRRNKTLFTGPAVDTSKAAVPRLVPAQASRPQVQAREADQPANLSPTLSNLFAAFLREMATVVVDEMESRKKPSAPANKSAEAVLIDQFRQFLESYAFGTPEMRDRLSAEHGAALVEVMFYLVPLSIPDREKRERDLSLQRRFNS